MIKKPITFVNFNGEEQTKDFYFHLSLPELTKMEAKYGADIGTYAKKLAENKDMPAMIAFLEEMILGAHGIKSEDGSSFRKNAKIREDFEYSQAYADLFEELLTNPQSAQAFGTGLATGTRGLKPQGVVDTSGLHVAPKSSHEQLELFDKE